MLHRIALRVLPSLSLSVTAPAVRARKRVVMLIPGLVAWLVYTALKQAGVIGSFWVLMAACALLASITAVASYRIGRAATYAEIWAQDRARLPWLIGWIGAAYGIQLGLLVLALLRVLHYDYLQHPDGPAMMALIIAVTSVARDAFEIGYLRSQEQIGRPLMTFPDGRMIWSALGKHGEAIIGWSVGAAVIGAAATVSLGGVMPAPETEPAMHVGVIALVGATTALFGYLFFAGQLRNGVAGLASIGVAGLFRFWWWPGIAFAATYALVGVAVLAYAADVAMTVPVAAALSAAVCGLLTLSTATLGTRRVLEDRRAVPEAVLRCPFVVGLLNKARTAVFVLIALAAPAAALADAGEPAPLPAEDVYYHTTGVPSGPPAPGMGAIAYPRYGSIDSRLLVWFVTQQHTYFGGFVLALPIFCVLIEFLGLTSRDPNRAARYDRLARDFIRVALLAFSITAIVGSVMLSLFISLYPSFMSYMGGTFKTMMPAYAAVFLGEALLLVAYYYSWDRLATGAGKWLHAALGVAANAFGAALLFLANGWIAFMMSPSGVDAQGRYLGNVWHLLHSALWNPLNVHRFLADIMSGGAVVLAYASYRFLRSRTPDERAYYDWVGYVFLFVTVCALLPMPFAGYWLMRSVYEFRQSMGVTMMGGLLTWLFVVQAVLIAVLFLGINYYLWQSLSRLGAGDRYRTQLKWLVVALMGCVLVWLTPHTLFLSASEVKAMGGAQHPVIGYYGVMSAKNGAINVMICLTAISYILYRRANRTITVPWARTGNTALAALFALGIGTIIWLAVYGFSVPASVRVALSTPQALTTLTVVGLGLLINRAMLAGAPVVGPIHWGRMPARGMVVLFIVAAAFSWVMGLMGYIRSSGRLAWHVNEIMPDVSPWAYTPALGFAAKMVTFNMLVFWLTVFGLFWLSSRDQDPARRGASWRMWPERLPLGEATLESTRVVLLVLAGLALLSVGSVSAQAGRALIEEFRAAEADGFPSGWENERGRAESQARSAYKVKTEDGTSMLTVRNANQRIKKKHIAWNPKTHPVLTWRWRLHKAPAGADPIAVVYAALDTDLLFIPVFTKYVWSPTKAPGTLTEGGMFSGSEIVLRSGTEPLETWVEERVNAYEDFKRIHKHEPQDRAWGISLFAGPGVELDVGPIAVEPK